MVLPKLSLPLYFQSKESSPPLSKTPSPGQSLDLVSEGRRRGKRGREEDKAGEGKKVKEEEEQERITVISITPQPMVTSTRPLPAPLAAQKKSNLRPARCQTLFPLVRLSYHRHLISTFRPQATAAAAPSSTRIPGEGGGGGGGGG